MTNLLKNSIFEDPPAPPATLTGIATGGASGAPCWTTWNNTRATTTTDVLPSTRLDGSKQTLHVCTTGRSNRIVQVFSDAHHAPKNVHSSVWDFVVRGRVGMGTNHKNNAHIDVTSQHKGVWDLLSAPNGVSPATEFIVYSVSPGACFYVEHATVKTNVWTSIGPEGGRANALAIDPATPSTHYAGTLGGGVFKSTDGGATWSAVNTGLTATDVRALAIDPVTPGMLCAGTYGGSVSKSTGGGAT